MYVQSERSSVVNTCWALLGLMAARSGQVRSGRVGSGWVRSCQVRSGQVWLGQSLNAHDNSSF